MAALRNSIRRAHKFLALIIGVQFLFWTLSGLFFTIHPIDEIRGEHLRHEVLQSTVGFDRALVAPNTLVSNAEQVLLLPGLSGPWYEVKTKVGYAVYDARNGSRLTPWNEEEATTLATAYWKGDGQISSVKLENDPPREAASSSPLWRVQFEGADSATFWVYSDRAGLRAVRTTNWRIFDILWRVHIMDFTGEDKIHSWWLRLAAFLGLTVVLFGIALLVDRAIRGRLLN